MVVVDSWWQSFRRAARLGLVVMLAGLYGCATPPPPAMPDEPIAEPRLTATEALFLSDYTLAPGDQIRISVYQHPELEKQLVIPPSGVIFFPLVGDVSAGGRTLRQVQSTIRAGLSGGAAPTIAVGDEIAIDVVRHAEFSVRAAVSPSGEVIIPIAGPVTVAGKTLQEADQAVAEQLAAYVRNPQIITRIGGAGASGVIGNPQVSVDVIRFSGQKVFVLGEVRRPGVFAMEGHTSLIEAIALAGGPTLDAEETSVALVRPIRGGRPGVTLINLQDQVSGTAQAELPTLQRGDIVYVPRSFIANVDRFFQHAYVMIRPIVDVESGIWLWQNIDEGPRRATSTTVIRSGSD